MKLAAFITISKVLYTEYLFRRAKFQNSKIDTMTILK